MHCPFCHHRDTRVLDSRIIDDGARIRRRRLCENPACASRFNTFETVELDYPLIIKQSGNREPYDRNKLRNSLLRAIGKSKMSGQVLEDLIQNLNKKLIGCGAREVTSSQIGNWVMEELQKVDQVAYIRFASVYLDFSDIESFQRAIDDLALKQR